jgi:hypothetical protein
MKVIAVLLVCFLVKIASSNGTEMPEKWQKIKSLVDEEIRTIEGSGLNRADLKYRLFELYSERIKIIREKENKTFLSEDPNLLKQHGKAFYFTESNKEYDFAHQYGLDLIKTYPKDSFVADIYYTLALNSRDYAKDDRTEKYLKLALSAAKGNSPIIYHAKTSLAEFYYNNKEYSKALSFYQDVLKNSTDEWHSKNLLNASWCMLKVKSFKEALTSIKAAFEFSHNKKYIDVSAQALESMGIFFVHAGEVAQGIEFYAKNTKAPASHLMKMAQHTADEGSINDTIKILEAALAHSKRQQNVKDEVIVYKAELDIYRQYQRQELYYKTSNNIESLNRKFPLSDADRDEIVQKISEYVGFLQIKLSKNKKVISKNDDPELLSKVVRYFEILSSIDQQNSAKYSFFTGESYYSVKMNLKAASSYKQAYEFFKKSPSDDPELSKKILNSLLAVISSDELKGNTQKEFMLYAYENYLAAYPVDEKAQLLYTKLFNLNMELSRAPEAIVTVDTYSKNYPSDIEIHRNMINTVMDFYIKQKNTDQLAFWVKKLEGGYLSFESAYVKKATLVLGQILFEKYQVMDKNGKKAEAAAGYLSIYENKIYPDKVKAESAYNASILFLEIGNIEGSFSWFEKSIAIFPKEELFKLRASTLSLSEHYALLQDFTKGAKVSELMLNDFCSEDFAEKSQFYSLAVSYRLVQGEYPKAHENYSKHQACAIPEKTKNDVGISLMSELYENRKYDELYLLTDKLRLESQAFDSTLARLMIDIYWDTAAHQDSVNLAKSAKYLDHIHQNKHEYNLSAELHHEIDEIHLFLNYRKDLISFMQEPIKMPNPFVAQDFNLLLEDQMLKLKDLTDSSTQFLKNAYPELSLNVYDKLIEVYSQFSKKVSALSPSDQPKEFRDSFQAQMDILSKKFMEKAADYHQSANNLILKNKLYTGFNKEFNKVKPLKELGTSRYPASLLVVPMDTLKGKR